MSLTRLDSSRNARVMRLLLCISLTLLTACASTIPAEPEPNPTGILIEGFLIRNGLPYSITDVMIEVPATGAFAGCGNLLPYSQCRSGFETVDYFGNAARVSWKEHGKSASTGEIVVEVPDDMAPGTVSEVEVIIFAPGQAGARLIRKVP